MHITLTSLIAKKYAKLLGNTQYGVIHLIAPDNRIITAGGIFPGPEVTWKLHDWRVLFRYITCGDRALGEDYMADRWEADSLKNLRDFFRMNCDRFKKLSNCTLLNYVFLLLSKIAFCRKHSRTQPFESEFQELLENEIAGSVSAQEPHAGYEEIRYTPKPGKSAAILNISEFRKPASDTSPLLQ